MTQSSPDKTVTNAPLQPSYVSGISTLPLLGDTIGANLDRTTARSEVRRGNAGVLRRDSEHADIA